jgi:hypothetical protein
MFHLDLSSKILGDDIPPQSFENGSHEDINASSKDCHSTFPRVGNGNPPRVY